MKLVVLAAASLLITIGIGAACPAHDSHAIFESSDALQLGGAPSARRIGSNGPDVDGLRIEIVNRE